MNSCLENTREKYLKTKRAYRKPPHNYCMVSTAHDLSIFPTANLRTPLCWSDFTGVDDNYILDDYGHTYSEFNGLDPDKIPCHVQKATVAMNLFPPDPKKALACNCTITKPPVKYTMRSSPPDFPTNSALLTSSFPPKEKGTHCPHQSVRPTVTCIRASLDSL